MWTSPFLIPLILILLIAGLLGAGDHVVGKFYWQIIDAVIAEVLQHIQRDTFAAAGKAADNNQAHAAISVMAGFPAIRWPSQLAFRAVSGCYCTRAVRTAAADCSAPPL